MSTDHEDHDPQSPQEPEHPGSNYQPLSAIPDTAKTLIKFEILEDLADSQLMWTINEHDVHPSQYLSIISLMANLTSTMSDRYTVAQAASHARMVEHVNTLCERVGVDSPFQSRDDIGEGDVESTLDDIEKFLNSGDDDV